MKLKLLGALTLATALLVGCATSEVEYDSTKRSPTTQLDFFRDAQKPSRPYKEVALLTDDGALNEQGAIEAGIIKKAKRMGGDAVIFHPLVKSGGELKGFSWVDNYCYKATVVVYVDK
ncbi:MAG TPA: hypothetical protein VJA21_03115 [Verrucomicrobiae bacterium]